MMKYSYKMIKLFVLILVYVASLAFVHAQEHASDNEQVVATINGDVVTAQQIEQFRMIMAQQAPAQYLSDQFLLNEIIKINLLAQEAEKLKLEERPGVKQALEQQRKSMLSILLMQEVTMEKLPTEAEVYDAYLAIPAKEYRISYILVNSESEAIELIKQLETGANFSTLASQHSIDATRDTGGQLGWVSPMAVEYNLLNEIKQLSPGKFSTKPVPSDQGWQLLKIEDARPTTKPAFEEVKQQLSQNIVKKQIEEFVTTLKSKAKITYQ